MEKDKIVINKSKKNLSKQELQSMTQEELIERIIKLEAHNKQLKNILEKKVNPKVLDVRRKDTDRAYDFSKSFKRHILLKFLYLGWDYQGFVVQEDTSETIEFYLFNALSKICLIESRETSNYNRCGRTDKGVSAFEQVVSLDVRSKIPEDEQLSQYGVDNEIKYCSLLNKVLPKNIRCTAWMPLATLTYSARFDCVGRTYRYYFPEGSLDIEAMRVACKHLIGSHDFRNLCKMDVGNGVVTYIRRLEAVDIHLASKDGVDKAYDMYYLQITGNAFLWHQIRCIVAILMLIGNRKESPDVMRHLLSVDECEQKPTYNLAFDIPLNLFFCNFRDERQCKQNEGNLSPHDFINQWIFDGENLKEVIEDLQEQWCTESVKCTMTQQILTVLNSELLTRFPNIGEIKSQASSLHKDIKCREYRKLLDRQRCSTLEDRIEHFTKRKRIKIQEPTQVAEKKETNSEKIT